MCGIAGKLDPRGEISPELLSSMCASMAHRGPDDEGTYSGPGIGLAHRRLSVQDLSSAGHQPMSTEDGGLTAVYNGEVYNFHELRAGLERLGHRFRSCTDTEVVIHAYRQWGPACLDRFNGMFGLAIWDSAAQTLFLARDRLGIKPVYYTLANGAFVFASELKTLLADPIVNRALDPAGLQNYFALGHSVAPITIFKSVRKLEPGHYLTCRVEGRQVNVRKTRYWQAPLPEPYGTPLPEKEYENRIYEILETSVRRRLTADVPVGVFLSGGIDSSAVTGLATQISGGGVETFSVGFEEIGGAHYNETEDARAVSKLFKTSHHELTVGPQDIADHVQKLAYHYDEPYADAASLPLYMLSAYARNHVTVVLSGEGSDEIFGGYRRYSAEDVVARYGWLGALLWFPGPRHLLGSVSGSGRVRRLLRGLSERDPVRRYVGWLRVFTPDAERFLFTPEWRAGMREFGVEEVYRGSYPARGRDHVSRLMYLDQLIWLPDTYLEKVDKATMGVGLEARVPFLDHELVEFAAHIPSSLKVRRQHTKYILKRALRKLLPDEVLNKKKQGFAVPYPVWFRGALRDFVEDTLFSDRAKQRGMLNPGTMRVLTDRYYAGGETNYRQLWLLVMFELWCRHYLDGDGLVVSHAAA
jgi:asparagine synthase (glutamine-hydrolysing)